MAYRTAYVTGASSGIGRAIARRLARDGTHVAIAARREVELDGLAREIRAAGGDATVFTVDVGDPDAATAAVRAADDALGGLDLVVANAGLGRQRWSGKLTWADVEPLVRVNVSGAVATLLGVLGRMVERKSGHLAGVTSLAKYRGLPKNAAYSATKAFLSTFLEGLRVDLRPSGIAVTDVQPGFVRTAMTENGTGPMPFIVDAESAADTITRGLYRREAVIAFPWPLAAVVRSASILPPALYDRAVARARS